jgi:hypothetical protein
MIFKLKFDDRTEFAQAKSQLHLLQSYDQEFEGFQEIEEVEEISDKESKRIMLINTDYDKDHPEDMPKEFSLFDMSVGDDFEIIGSTEWG